MERPGSEPDDSEPDDSEPRECASSSLCPGAGSACVPTGEARSDVEAFVERYPEGETVTAYVQADEPSNAHLESDGAAHWYLALSGIGVAVVLLSVRRRLRES